MIDYTLLVLLRGLVLSILYFYFTKANDSNIYNVVVFTSFFFVMTISAKISDLNDNVVTTAFFSKIIFTMIENIKFKEGKEEDVKDNSK